MVAVIISGFPGVGKSVSSADSGTFIDSDSSLFSWDRDEHGEIKVGEDGKNIRHSEWPQNYMNHIRKSAQEVDVIFVSSHSEVRDALVGEGMHFSLVYPQRESLDEYVARYEKRGSPQGFIDFITDNWDEFIGELEQQKGCTHYVLNTGQYLSNILDSIRTPAVPARAFKYPTRSM